MSEEADKSHEGGLKKVRDKFSLSVCVVTYNEEENVRDCLKSVAWADEIIVVDSFSSDKTTEICREFTDEVVQREWKGQIDQKNFALSRTKYDWVLLIDADERLSPSLIEEMKKELSKKNSEYDGFCFPRHVHYLGRWINHGEWYPDHKLRLFRKAKGRIGGIEPHDKVKLTGRQVKYLKGDLWHFTYKNIFAQVETLNRFSSISAQEMAKQGKAFQPLQILSRPIMRFITAYIIRTGFRDGMPGFIIAVISSFYVFLKYFKLWELQNESKVQSLRSRV